MDELFDRAQRPVDPPFGAGPGPGGGGPPRGPGWAPDPSRKGTDKTRKRGALVAGGVFAVFTVLYLVAFFYTGSGVPRGTKVLGVDIGGISRTAAERKLEMAFESQASEPLPVRVEETVLELNPPEAGLTVDVAATVREAGGRSLNPLTLFSTLFGAERDVEVQVAADPEKLRASLASLASEVTTAPREGDVVFEEGEAVPVEPRAGRTIDVEGSQDVLVAGFLRTKGPLSLPMQEVEPKVTESEVDRALEEFGKPAMSGSVLLRVDKNGDANGGTEEEEVSPKVIGKHLDMKADESGTLQPVLDVEGFMKDVEEDLDKFGEEAEDASFKIAGGRPEIVPATVGKKVVPEDLQTKLIGVLPETDEDERVAELELTDVEPELTTEKAKSLGVKEIVSKFTTYYPSNNPNRLQNIHRAADLMRGSVVLPGKVWSLNETVGERTRGNGFTVGTIILNGRYAKDLGGGVSQVATTTFNAVFYAGLEDVEHKPHSFYISRYPVGVEATVAWPSVDLRFRNDSGNALVIDTSYTNSSLTVTFWGTKKYDDVKAVTSDRYNIKQPEKIVDDDPKCVPQQPVEGFEVDVSRIFIKDGSEAKRDRFHARYNPSPEVVCTAGDG